MAKTNYLRTQFLNHLRGTAYPTPGALYLGLFTTDPTAAMTGTEVSGGSYVRQPVVLTVPNPSYVCFNTVDILYPIATADWGNLTHYAIFDAPSGGNGLYIGTISAPRTILTSDQYRVSAGQLTVTES